MLMQLTHLVILSSRVYIQNVIHSAKYITLLIVLNVLKLVNLSKF